MTIVADTAPKRAPRDTYNRVISDLLSSGVITCRGIVLPAALPALINYTRKTGEKLN